MGSTAGMLLTAGSTVSQYQALNQQAGAIRRQSDFQTKLADLTAGDIVSRGTFEANKAALQGRQLAGTQAAGYAASGIDSGSGSAAAVQGDTARFSALDEQMIRNNAAREAWGYKAQARLDAAGAQNEADNLVGQSYATLLTGAVNTYGIYADKPRTRTTGGGGGGVSRASNGGYATPPAPRGGYNLFKK